MGSCRFAAGEVAGWRSVVIENDAIRVVVLPDKGAEIHQITELRSGTDLLFEGPWGLRPPGAPPLPGSGDDEFMWNYAGGWQELFPSVNEACAYRGKQIPFHGEVASLPWEHEILDGDGSDARVRFWTGPGRRRFGSSGSSDCARERPSSASRGRCATSRRRARTSCGVIIASSGRRFSSRAAGSRSRARTIVTSPELWEPETARLEPGRREAWPWAPLRTGGTVDLRDVPGPETGSHDDLYVTDLDEGWLAVSNPRLDLTFRLEWDQRVFGWIVLLAGLRRCSCAALSGSYALGVEPWTSMLSLEQAIAAGVATELAGGASFTTSLRARVLHA